MERRAFLGAVTGGLLAAPLAARAQQAGKVYRVGLLFFSADPSSPVLRLFRQALSDLGYVEGRNLVLERRYLERYERASEVAAELVGLKVDVIVSGNNVATRAAKEATTSIPIVMANNGLPVETGLVASLAHPGGNVTGVVQDTGPELQGKRLGLLKEIAPRISRVAWFGSKLAWERDPSRQYVQAVARSLGVTLFHAESQPPDFTPAFAAVTRERADAIFVTGSPENNNNRRIIIEFAAQKRLPASYLVREAVQDGGLMSYGVSLGDAWRRIAEYVDKILKGSKPADLPVEQATKFELVINLKTAKALGLTIPPSVLARADEVIQ